MFVDISVFEVEEGMQGVFERDFLPVVERARAEQGCLSSELVRLEEERRYAWVERWESREQHNAFNEILFGQILPNLPDIGRYSTRLVEREAEGYVVERTSPFEHAS
ncbi:antibiotic biosynthesis monooxygenase [Sphaerobacter sp.]|uniref:putative quinol monooxygenase n=1 Tax=Sphaerobacter sp. TaxID=2099654 RepID=UPI001D24A93D|nr:antibiotic biosynthesis monooxygenase [Sphaerobacter sp.]MBX5444877.1 antibiotic biosynthesis monooxygenase [Sphaerobacter sp.]